MNSYLHFSGLFLLLWCWFWLPAYIRRFGLNPIFDLSLAFSLGVVLLTLGASSLSDFGLHHPHFPSENGNTILRAIGLLSILLAPPLMMDAQSLG